MIKSNIKLTWELPANDAWITVDQSYAIYPLDLQLKELKKKPKGQHKVPQEDELVCVVCGSSLLSKWNSIYSRLGEQLQCS